MRRQVGRKVGRQLPGRWVGRCVGSLFGRQVNRQARIYIAIFEPAEGRLQKLVCDKTISKLIGRKKDS